VDPISLLFITILVIIGFLLRSIVMSYFVYLIFHTILKTKHNVAINFFYVIWVVSTFVINL